MSETESWLHKHTDRFLVVAAGERGRFAAMGEASTSCEPRTANYEPSAVSCTPCTGLSCRHSDCLDRRRQCLLAQRLVENAREIPLAKVGQYCHNQLALILRPRGNFQRRRDSRTGTYADK